MMQEMNTDLVDNQDRAVELQQLGFVTSGIVHDFNNLLTTILGEAGMALREMPPDCVGRDRVERVEKTAKYAARLVGSLMAYVSGRETFQETVDLNLLITDTVSLLHTTYERIDFQLYLAHHLPSFRAREGHIQQVAMNLLINAAQAIRNNQGIVRVRTGDTFLSTAQSVAGDNQLRPGRYVFLQVSDNGPGIREELLDHIFDPFFTARFQGRGLGLATVVSILSQYGGGIVVENLQDTGTSFTVYIPYNSQSLCVG
ncbi:MAG: hypothetical protein KC443_13845 [Anaerolineales bacterium]|nr:hypothetical protein [Anaerolineales bacterium]